jgi:Mn-containing catalase
MINEKIVAFHDQLQDLISEHATEELSHGTLIQELMSLSVSNAYIFAEDTDQVDWTIRYIKKEALKKRKEIEDELISGGELH